MSNFTFSKRSKQNLLHVHPDLVEVMTLALSMTHIDFVVIEGIRPRWRQKELFEAGASTTMNSLHLKQKTGYAHAVDIAALVGGDIRWDWPLYEELAVVIKQAAKALDIPIEWGGDWESFKDGPHYQLPRSYFDMRYGKDGKHVVNVNLEE